jgi:hypothetical protein
MSLLVNPSGVEPGISAEALYKKIGFKSHSPGQHDYLLSKARFNVPCCGRRYGKSIVAGHRMTHKSFVPDSWNWIVGPTYKLGEKEFRVTYDDYRKLGLLKYCRKGYSAAQGTMYIKTPWGATIEVVSADKPDSLLGEGLSHAIMSEAARHDQSTWEQYVEPALSDLLGSCDFPSTPKGYNWYHGLWLLGQEADLFNLHAASNRAATTPQSNQPTPNPNNIANITAQQPELAAGMSQYRSWSFPTWENSVRFPGGLLNPEIQRVKRLASKHWFDQEYGASFTTMAGTIYEEFNDKTMVIRTPTDPLQCFNPAWANYLAFDYGFSNPFVCLDIQVDQDDTFYVWREYYKSYISTHEHGLYLLNRPQPQGYHIDAMWGDPRGADQAATLALTIGYVSQEDTPYTLAVEELKRLMKADKVRIHHSCTNLIRQLTQLHVKEQLRRTSNTQDFNEYSNEGNIQHKIDDHAADALRYFIGPYYVNGAGISLADVYGQQYKGSESEQFVLAHNDHITLGTTLY